MTHSHTPPQTLAEHLARIDAGSWSATAAIRHSLGICRELEGGLRAWVELWEQSALDRAGALDALAPEVRASLPLFGLPVGVKDLFDLAGHPTGCGSARLRAAAPAGRDAALVAALRDAGAIVLGKTVTTHFACFDPPATANPWDPQRTPGGSSSGSAVAVATGMCLAALGSQTGGSITRPASYCGVVGWKPTFGVLPIAGVFPVAPSLDHPGPLVRTAVDLLLLGGVLLGRPVGLFADNGPAWPRIGSGESRWPARGSEPGPLRAAVVDDSYLEPAEPDCRQVFQETVDHLRQAGMQITPVVLPWPLAHVLAVHRRIMLAEIAQRHVAWLEQWPGDYLPGMRALIEEGAGITDGEYRVAKARQQEMQQEIDSLMEGCRLLLTPATRGGAPHRSSTGEPTFNAPFSLWGLPTVNLPMGRASTGLPLSLQVAGRRGHDWDLLQAAVWFESTLAREPIWHR